MKLSIVTINLNNKDGLLKTIHSVINQTFKDFEYIVIDGGSKDGSIEIIKEFESYIHYWISEKDNGVYNAMNKGIRFAKGEYVYFLNSGDCLISKTTLTSVFACRISTDFIIGGVIHNLPNRKLTVKYKKNLSFIYFLNASPNHQATFTKRILFEKYGFYDESLKIAADWKFIILSIYKYNRTYTTITENVSYYQTGGISSNTELSNKEKNEIIQNYFSNYSEDIKELMLVRRLKIFKKLKNKIFKLFFNKSIQG